MAKVALNIAKAYYIGFVADFEKSRYFQLHKNAASRADLYSFAIAKIEGKEPTDTQPVNSSGRTVHLGNYEAFLSALYYEDKLKDNPNQIDDICNRDKVYTLAEKYANTCFGILKN